MNAGNSRIDDQVGATPAEVAADEMEFAYALARMAKALAHPTRVEIVCFLLEQGECVCGDIVQRLPLVQSTVSQHLKQLREAGLVSGRRERCRTVYRANPAAFIQLRLLVGALADEQVSAENE